MLSGKGWRAVVILGFSHLPWLPHQGSASEAGAPALIDYIGRPDPSFAWRLVRTGQTGAPGVHTLWLRSQTWRGIPWTHQLVVILPDGEAVSDTCLLLLAGGGNRNGEPDWVDDEPTREALRETARRTMSPVAVLGQVPNQPLFEGRREDGLIAHTFRRFLDTGDPDWPLLLPMTKSAVRAMDAVVEFCARESGRHVRRFVVTGASKRGWTAWLTGAVDARVAGIAPMAIDVLNIPRHLDYQIEAWGAYSSQIRDYTEQNLPDRLRTEEGRRLADLVDPYAYRDRITMPKLIFIGTNDPYWPVDAVKLYLPSLRGRTHLHYVANAGHGLGDGRQALRALTAFQAATAADASLPAVEWDVSAEHAVTAEGGILLAVRAGETLSGAVVWTASSPTRDFRKAHWTAASLQVLGERRVEARLPLPESGYKAFYAEMFFPSAAAGTYGLSTRIYVAGPEGVLPEEAAGDAS